MKVQMLNFTKNISQSAEMIICRKETSYSCIQQSCSLGCCVSTVANQSSAKHSSRLTLQVENVEPRTWLKIQT